MTPKVVMFTMELGEKAILSQEGEKDAEGE